MYLFAILSTTSKTNARMTAKRSSMHVGCAQEPCPKYFVSDVHESILAIREIVIYLHLQYSSKCHILNSAISEDTPDR